MADAPHAEWKVKPILKAQLLERLPHFIERRSRLLPTPLPLTLPGITATPHGTYQVKVAGDTYGTFVQPSHAMVAQNLIKAALGLSTATHPDEEEALFIASLSRLKIKTRMTVMQEVAQNMPQAAPGAIHVQPLEAVMQQPGETAAISMQAAGAQQLKHGAGMLPADEMADVAGGTTAVQDQLEGPPAKLRQQPARPGKKPPVAVATERQGARGKGLGSKNKTAGVGEAPKHLPTESKAATAVAFDEAVVSPVLPTAAAAATELKASGSAAPAAAAAVVRELAVPASRGEASGSGAGGSRPVATAVPAPHNTKIAAQIAHDASYARVLQQKEMTDAARRAATAAGQAVVPTGAAKAQQPGQPSRLLLEAARTGTAASAAVQPPGNSSNLQHPDVQQRAMHAAWQVHHAIQQYATTTRAAGEHLQATTADLQTLQSAWGAEEVSHIKLQLEHLLASNKAVRIGAEALHSSLRSVRLRHTTTADVAAQELEKQQAMADLPPLLELPAVDHSLQPERSPPPEFDWLTAGFEAYEQGAGGPNVPAGPSSAAQQLSTVTLTAAAQSSEQDATRPLVPVQQMQASLAAQGASAMITKIFKDANMLGSQAE